MKDTTFQNGVLKGIDWVWKIPILGGIERLSTDIAAPSRDFSIKSMKKSERAYTPKSSTTDNIAPPIEFKMQQKAA
jgi:hypothetical protein